MWSLQVRNILSYLFLVILFQPPDHGAQNDWTNKSQAKFNETRKSQWDVIVSESGFLFLCTLILGRNLFQFLYFQSTSELISAHCVKLNGWVGLFVFSFTWESRCKNHKYCFLTHENKRKKNVAQKLTIAPWEVIWRVCRISFKKMS